MKPLQVLLAEDNEGDVYLVREALRAHSISCQMTVFTDGIGISAYLDRLGKEPDLTCPDVFLLDLNIPMGDGHDVLNAFREHPVCGKVPVIVVTSSDAPRDRERAASLGANEYFRKPSDFEEFMNLGAMVLRLINADGKPS